MKTLSDVQPGDIVILHSVDGTWKRLRVVSITKTTITTQRSTWSKITGRKRGTDARWEPEWIEAT